MHAWRHDREKVVWFVIMSFRLLVLFRCKIVIVWVVVVVVLVMGYCGQSETLNFAAINHFLLVYCRTKFPAAYCYYLNSFQINLKHVHTHTHPFHLILDFFEHICTRLYLFVLFKLYPCCCLFLLYNNWQQLTEGECRKCVVQNCIENHVHTIPLNSMSSIHSLTRSFLPSFIQSSI